MSIENLAQYFSTIDDPRCFGKVEHRLLDILVIAVCAVIACAERPSDREGVQNGHDLTIHTRCRWF